MTRPFVIRPFDISANCAASPVPSIAMPDGNIAYGSDGFTKRERACIDLLYPDSGLDWLNEMIRVRKREEMARAAITGKSDYQGGYCPRLIEDAYRIADAMLKEGGGE